MDDIRDKSQPISLGAELIIPILTAAFAIYYLTTVWHLPWEANFAALCTIGALAVLLAILMVRYARAYLSGQANFGFEALLEPRGMIGRRLMLLGSSIAFVLVMPVTGFTLSLWIFLIFTLTMLAGRQHLRTIIILSTIVSVCTYLLFVGVVQVRFPSGPFEYLLSHLVFWR